MRVLLLTGSSARYMAPPSLGDEQIVAGPDWTDAHDAAGRVVSLRTPAGDYDLATVLARLPADQRPDAVVSLVDASWRNTPRNVGVFAGPKALLVADTHHLASPLLGMFRYAATEPYDRIVFLYDRHHLPFFRSAGLRNLSWFPGLTLPHADATVRAVRASRRERRIAFVGQTGKFHPQRTRLLEALSAADLPLASHRLSQEQSLRLYGTSLVGFNASLNGDLNLRVFEILATGAALLTDRLAADSGLGRLFTEGRELVTYGSPEEVVERAAHLVAQPKEAAAIGAAGAKWFDTHFNASRRRAAFQDLLLTGRSLPEFDEPAGTATSVHFGGDTDQLLRALMVYEGVQELHRTEPRVRVALTPGVHEDVARVCATLPRVELARGPVTSDADITIFTRDDPPAAGLIPAPRLWCSDAADSDRPALEERLGAAGFTAVSSDVAVFCRIAPVEAAVAEETAAGAATAAPHVLLFTDDPDSGGVAQYNHSLICGLVEAGYRVSVAQSRADNPLVARQRELGVVHHWIPYDTKKEFARTLGDQATARGIFGLARPDLVVFSDCCPVSNLAAREVALLEGVPYVCVIGFVGAYLADRFQAMLGRLAAQYAAARAVVAVSQENLDLLHARFGLPAGDGQVIHYGRPEKFFAPRDEAVRARLRAELGLPADAVVCFTAARLAAVKGFQFQLAAARHLVGLPGNDRLHFVWAGDGDQRAALTKAITTHGLDGRIHLLGHRWDVADWFDASDIFVLPSDLEGMPLAIMEAMAKGLPVAATAVSGIPEELGPTGQLLPPAASDRDGLVRELVRTLHLWANDDDLRRRVGEAGRARAREMFRESLMIERTVAVVGRHVAAAEPAGVLATA